MARIFFIPSLFLLLIAVSAYIARSDPVRDSNAIVFANPTPIYSRDPTEMSWSHDIRLAMGLFEGLVIYDQTKPGAFLPGVAETWEQAADHRTWTFHLRKNARWNNGDPVTAHDFIFAWKRALTLASGCQYESLFNSMKGAKEYFDSQAPGKTPLPWDSVGLKALDDYTIQIEISRPCSFLFDILAMPAFFPQHARSMEKFKTEIGDYDAKFTRPGNLVSNGPFYLKAARWDDYQLLEKNPYYWDAASVQATSVKIVTRTDSTAALIELKNGMIDVFSTVPSESAPELEHDREAGVRDDVFLKPVFSTYFFLFNCSRKPLDDSRVRLALALAVDKQLIVDNITRMHQTPVNSFTPPDSIPGYTAPHGLDRDPDRARKLLAEAGYPDGKGMRPIEILYPTDVELHKQVSEAMAQAWQKELHIQVILMGVDGKEFSARRAQEHDFDVCRAGWTGDYSDPVTWLDLCRTGDGNNDQQYSNPAYDALMDKAAGEFDPEKRFKILNEAETLLTDHDMPFLPLYQDISGYMYDPKKIGGMDLNTRELTQMKFLHRLDGGRK